MNDATLFLSIPSDYLCIGASTITIYHHVNEFFIVINNGSTIIIVCTLPRAQIIVIIMVSSTLSAITYRIY